MKCEQVKLELVSLLFSELAEDERERLMTHISQCPACRKEWVELKSTEAVMAGLKDEEPQSDLVFVNEQPSVRFRNILNWIFSPPVVRWGIAAAIIALGIWLAKPSFNYDHNSLTLVFGKAKPAETLTYAQVDELINREREETIKLVSQMLNEGSEKQRNEYTIMLAALARDFDRRRLNDLDQIESGLLDVQRNSQVGIAHTNLILSDLIKNASYSNATFRK
jgi:hypothetical protein